MTFLRGKLYFDFSAEYLGHVPLTSLEKIYFHRNDPLRTLGERVQPTIAYWWLNFSLLFLAIIFISILFEYKFKTESSGIALSWRPIEYCS